MASVVLCTDERLGRRVAVKRLHADQPGEVERRLVREAKLGASLNHPNLVAVFDTATDDEGVLIVMEYVEGEPLSRALRHGPLERRHFGRMAVELGDALDHAHAHGVVHRDVKPSNVLLRRDGVTKLVDLGIATAAGHTRITGSGVVLGTAAYMAPEQLDGRPAESPADVYAFSCVCFEALSGHRARKGRTSIEIAHRIATEPAPDLREALPEASPAAAALLARGMARDPADRPASAGELGRELRRELGSAPAAAAPRPTASPRPAAAAAPTAAATPAASPARTSSAPAPPARPARTSSAPAPAPRPARRVPRPGLAAILLALATLALGGAVLAGVLASGDDGGTDRAQTDRGTGGDPSKQRTEADRADDGAGAQAPAQPAAPSETQPEEPDPQQPAPQEPAQEDPAPAEQAPPPADGPGLNDRGFALMNEGRYEEAIPLLEQAVASYSGFSTDLGYAYALFNLGRSLRLAGRPADAVPILELRLQIPNQQGTVRRELALARRAAG